MHLKYVTITGADDHTDINKMIELSFKYPFVEWGILLSPSRMKTNRYPSIGWIDEMIREFRKDSVLPRLSFHFCGKFSRNILSSKYYNDDENHELIIKIEDLLKHATRVQINCNISQVLNKDSNFKISLEILHSWFYIKNIQSIITENSSNHDLWQNVLKFGVIPNVLFDASGGRGKTLPIIQFPISGVLCGYAGGIGDENIDDVLCDIEAVVGNGICWVDMESKVRNNNDRLDLNKVESVLKKCDKYSIKYSRGF